MPRKACGLFSKPDWARLPLYLLSLVKCSKKAMPIGPKLRKSTGNATILITTLLITTLLIIATLPNANANANANTNANGILLIC